MNVKELRDYLAQYQEDTPVLYACGQYRQPCYEDLETYSIRHIGDPWEEDFKLYIGWL